MYFFRSPFYMLSKRAGNARSNAGPNNIKRGMRSEPQQKNEFGFAFFSFLSVVTKQEERNPAGSAGSPTGTAVHLLFCSSWCKRFWVGPGLKKKYVVVDAKPERIDGMIGERVNDNTVPVLSVA